MSYSMVAGALNLFGPRVTGTLANWFGKAMSNELNRSGVRAEDLLIEDACMKEALDLADPNIAKGRYRRLLRASDLSYKGKEYQDYASVEKLRPFQSEIWDLAHRIEAREDEYNQLDAYK
mmetsp:Transcript_20623/g.26590  ORF Transcript_20623/g.26590 Transcript_20623/m.26590 type:complete len:120 (+) Transcript_20623:123-482(+)|eukprot:CAMPEP_0198143470 /NCGR_PEP_ID=MMETSP1443-20131203/7760_1 /TAXON_ID=186043 /ORGANISM="Entomoneis sp., Strain CCMP2396" /LENGTH=119 /DNA_ID=CAMNT_0043806709 /DNA_START=84 /DNA_END=443 /DNA_ORIENTATION=-